MSRPTPTQIKALQAKWRKKLEKSGFHDIEDTQGRFTDHKGLSDLYRLTGFRAGHMEAIRDYFYWATDMARRGKFPTPRDRKIWEMHSAGDSSREIAAVVPLDQSMICRRIKKIRKLLREQDQGELHAQMVESPSDEHPRVISPPISDSPSPSLTAHRRRPKERDFG